LNPKYYKKKGGKKGGRKDKKIFQIRVVNSLESRSFPLIENRKWKTDSPNRPLFKIHDSVAETTVGEKAMKTEIIQNSHEIMSGVGNREGDDGSDVQPERGAGGRDNMWVFQALASA